MFQKYTAYCLIFMMAINGLLATTAAGGAVLCLHDHDFGHVLSGQHADDGGTCHGDEAESHIQDSHHSAADSVLFSVSDQHCIDISISSSNEPIQRVADLISIKKPVVASYQYQLFAPVKKANVAPQLRFATRAPPISCGALEQCVRKTVLRI
ncbi:hypothetical protein N9Z14_00385 [Opitutales bacterium]|nr:hypothetical protein [Opitutales bacterium]